MADNLVSQLHSYKLQLQQVDAALTTDGDNDELLKLKTDLQEVITLTQDLVNAQVEATTSESPADAGHSWEVGGKCAALYAEEGTYYNAVVDEILEDGTCTVTFEEFGTTIVTQVKLLKKPFQAKKRLAETGDQVAKLKKKDQMAAEREYKKKKAQKKKMRIQKMEEEREGEKNKWLSFNAKTFSKTNKGKVKKSIFATPDSSDGKVGVGTCGVSGKGLTNFNKRQKWNK